MTILLTLLAVFAITVFYIYWLNRPKQKKKPQLLIELEQRNLERKLRREANIKRILGAITNDH